MDITTAEKIICEYESGRSTEDTCVINEAFMILKLNSVTIGEMKKKFPLKFKEVDWGSKPKGQGRRSGKMVMGAMFDVTIQGKKSYPDRAAQFNLSVDEALCVNLLTDYEYLTYWKLRTMGQEHADALMYSYDE